MVTSALVSRLASGVPLTVPPGVVDVALAAPPNPPEQVQVQFVGQSFERAYAEAEAFVTAVGEALRALGHPGLAGSRVLDLGSGWGRISRVLLTEVSPTALFAADVDPEMTALVNVSLPGINALTVAPVPPTVLADGSMDVAVAFSVFSHLSGPAHAAWARELARLVRPGGVVVITVIGEEFLDLVEGSQAAVAGGDSDGFTASVAAVFPDVAAVRARFRADEVQFGATGGGGVRTRDYYGWAVASRRAVERIWGDAGLDLFCWRPTGEPISQALAVLVRTERRPVAQAGRRARRSLRHAVGRSGDRLRARVPRPVRAVVRRVRRPRQL
ncbi:class I SAM-dependent methyltransferase [Blastococcus sp. CT_GayMR16]|uniref:class I SAM-dependent methyltransferase n=1 Tax=Blastococcus sp. CT_GayMR16 TaxID=2559607 RepID=UPI0010737863|nr:class I SAM-dependent methyltransferase [Blastococcus sp. CT_GayMR16]TFV87772.1 class I SAM-dependent methyltransferase [Blastococcus sp. CT_GayMR16]